MTSRRTFLKTSSLVGASLLDVPRLARAAVPAGNTPEVQGRFGDPDLKALAHRALEAATAAGASYADVRFTNTRQRSINDADRPFTSNASMSMNVRALAGGAWGVTSGTTLTPDAVAGLGQVAAESAKGSAWPNVPPVTLGPRPPVATGNWRMPVKRDPFDVEDAEYVDMIKAMIASGTINHSDFGFPLPQIPLFAFNFERQERTFASTEGAFTTQTVYNTFGQTRSLTMESYLGLAYQFRLPSVGPMGIGYEACEQLLETLPDWVDQARKWKKVNKFEAPGRYEVVLDAYSVAALVSALGTALQGDRALGEEQNATGTSFLAPFESILGTAQFPAAVTLTADRTMPGGVATVRWDDEGVAPEPFPLITDGVVVDYATSRQIAPELADWYKKRGLPVRSRGCLGSENALKGAPMVQTPNLVLRPAAEDRSFDDLLTGIDNGYALLGANVTMDQQQVSGRGTGTAYTVKRGKLGRPVKNVSFMFRVPELWKDLVALGGAKTAATVGFTTFKGQPSQMTAHSVQAVAARFKNVTLAVG